MATPTILLRNNPAYKASKLLGYNPYGTRFIPIEMDFARSSSGSVEKSTGIVNMGTGVPRVDVNGSVLLEPARTNLLTYSQQFDNAAWIKSDATISANAIIAPDGTLTADKVIAAATTANHRVEQTSAIGSAGWVEVYAKAGEYSYLQIYENISSGYQNFNLSTGTLASGAADDAIIESLGNGWYRCMYYRSSAFGVSRIAILDSDIATRAASFTGDGTSGVYLWGAQLEVGAYPTSYIKTEASTVTRAAETLSKTGLAAQIGDAEGCYYIQSFSAEDDSFLFSINDGTNSNNLYLRVNSSGNYAIVLRNGGTSKVIRNTNTAYQENDKVAVNLNTDGLAIWVNGVEIRTESYTAIPNYNFTTINVGSNTGGSSIEAVSVKAFHIWDTALTDTELAILTTL